MWVAVAIGGSALVGAGASMAAGRAQSKAAGQAADAQVQAAIENNEFQKWLYEDQKAQQQPWVDVGLKALGQLQRYAGVESSKAGPPQLVRRDSVAQTEQDAATNIRQKEIAEMDNSDYVKYMYKEGLGMDLDLSKPQDAEGLTYWKNMLDSGLSKEDVAAKMGAAHVIHGAKQEDIKTNNLYTPTYDEQQEFKTNDLKARQNALLNGGVR